MLRNFSVLVKIEVSGKYVGSSFRLAKSAANQAGITHDFKSDNLCDTLGTQAHSLLG